jgi:hypothetical protein
MSWPSPAFLAAEFRRAGTVQTLLILPDESHIDCGVRTLDQLGLWAL